MPARRLIGPGQPLSPGLFIGAQIPPGLGGQGLDLMLQTIVLDPGHNAVDLGASDGQLLQIR